MILPDGLSRLLGLKTAVIDEMSETLTLIGSLVEAPSSASFPACWQALEDDFVDFMAETCRNLPGTLEIQHV